MTAPEDLTVANFGPLLALAGSWEGEGGVDFSYHHAEKETGDTKYLEKVSFSTFGPVDNGTQSVYGLDYRMAAWRKGEENDDPFHTEIGYWLYDPAEQQIMRCFIVPRGVAVIAGGTAAPDATTFTIRADLGSNTYGVLSNKYLDQNSRTEWYEATITVGADEWTYEEDTVLKMNVQEELLHHTDRNTLRRVAG